MAFLQWQERLSPEHEIKSWSYSFIETFKKATVRASDDPAGLDVKLAPAIVGGASRSALWAHPPVAGQTIIEYYIPIPQQVRDIQLSLAIGIRDGAHLSENNLVAFGVRVNGARVWGRQTNEKVWQEATLALNLTAGDIIRFEFTTEALGNHEWTWAVWGNPELTGKVND